jgi:hypothetical protein
MTEYIDTAELAASIPDDHPYKARMLYANDLLRQKAQDRAEERAVDELTMQFTPAILGQAAPVDLAEQGDLDEEQVKRIKAELRRIALKLEDVEEGSDEHRRLKKRYHELQERLGELAGGDSDREKSFPLEDFSEQAPGSYRGVEWLEQVAAQPDAELPEEVRGDAELHAALRAQELADRFGNELAGVSDDEMWAAYRKTLGMEEG